MQLPTEIVCKDNQHHLHAVPRAEARLEQIQCWCVMQKTLELLSYCSLNNPEIVNLKLGSDW